MRAQRIPLRARAVAVALALVGPATLSGQALPQADLRVVACSAPGGRTLREGDRFGACAKATRETSWHQAGQKEGFEHGADMTVATRDKDCVVLAARQALGKRVQLLQEDAAPRGELERVTRALAVLAGRYGDLTRHIEVQTRGARITRIGLKVGNRH